MSKRGKHRKDDRTPEGNEAIVEAVAAHDDAAELLEVARARTSEVQNLVSALRAIRTRNHFGEMVRQALDGE